MLRHELYGMIHIPRLKDENTADLFLGFRHKGRPSLRLCHSSKTKS